MREIVKEQYQQKKLRHSKKVQFLTVLAMLAVVVISGVFIGLRLTGISYSEDPALINDPTQSGIQNADLIKTVDNIGDYASPIIVNLFDYQAYDEGRWPQHYNDLINNGHSLKFLFNGANANTGNNQWNVNIDNTNNYNADYYTDGEIALQGIVQNKLVDGYPKLTYSTSNNGNRTENQTQESLAYLFPANGTHGVENNYVIPYYNTTGLFKHENGWLTFNSDENYTYYYAEADKNQFVSSQTTNRKQGSTTDAVGFFPFNKLGNNDNNVDAGNQNHHFGMTMDAEFTLFQDGKINDQDMVFFFRGDDDMWVFIDGVLVLDIGGIHDPVQGMIDFATGAVTVSDAAQLGATRNAGKPNGHGPQNTTIDAQFMAATGSGFDTNPGQTHRIQIFYLERGGVNSNLLIQTNIFERQIVRVEKLWDDNGKAVDHSEDSVKYSLYKVDDEGQTEPQEISLTGHVDGSEGTPGILNAANNWRQSITDLEPSDGSFHYEVVETVIDTKTNYTYEGRVIVSGSHTDGPIIVPPAEEDTDQPGLGEETPSENVNRYWVKADSLASGNTYAFVYGGKLVRYINNYHNLLDDGNPVVTSDRLDITIPADSQWYYSNNGNLQNVALMNSGADATCLTSVGNGERVNNQYWYYTDTAAAAKFRVDGNRIIANVNGTDYGLTNDSYNPNSVAERQFTVYRMVEEIQNGGSAGGNLNNGNTGGNNNSSNDNMNTHTIYGDVFTIINKRLDTGLLQVTKRWEDNHGSIEPLEDVLVQLFQVRTPVGAQGTAQTVMLEGITSDDGAIQYVTTEDVKPVLLAQKDDGSYTCVFDNLPTMIVEGEGDEAVSYTCTYFVQEVKDGVAVAEGSQITCGEYDFTVNYQNEEQDTAEPVLRGKTTIINHHDGIIPRYVDLECEVIWKDYKGDIIEEAPAPSILKLHQIRTVEGEEPTDTVLEDRNITINPDDAPYERTYPNIPVVKTEDGKVVTYTYYIVEEPVDGYTTTYSCDATTAINEGKIIIINKGKFISEEVSVSVEKQWNIPEPEEEETPITLPTSVKVDLYSEKYDASGEKIADSEEIVVSDIVLDADHAWSYSREELPAQVFDEESRQVLDVKYFFREQTAADGFFYNGDDKYQPVYTENDGQTTITNEYISVETTKVPVEKIWNRADGSTTGDGSVTVQLFWTLTVPNSTATSTQLYALPTDTSFYLTNTAGKKLYVTQENRGNGCYTAGFEDRASLPKNKLGGNEESTIWQYDGQYLYTVVNNTEYYFQLVQTQNEQNQTQFIWTAGPKSTADPVTYSGNYIQLSHNGTTFTLNNNPWWAAENAPLNIRIMTVPVQPIREAYKKPSTGELYTLELSADKQYKGVFVGLPVTYIRDDVEYECTYEVVELGVSNGFITTENGTYASTCQENADGSWTITNTEKAKPYTPPAPSVVDWHKTIDNLETVNSKTENGVTSSEGNPDTTITDDHLSDDLYRIYLDLRNKTVDKPVDLLIVVDQSGSMCEEHDINFGGETGQYRDLVLSKILNGSATLINTGLAGNSKPTWQQIRENPNNKSIRRAIHSQVTQDSLVNMFLDLHPENRVAVVGFDANRVDNYDNDQFATAPGYTWEKDSSVLLNWTSERLTGEGLDVEGKLYTGTNYEAGLWRADQIINNDPGKDNGHAKVMIFFSDGVPTCYLTNNGNGRGGNTLSGDANNVSNCVLPSIQAFDRFKAAHSDLTIYSVGLSAELSADSAVLNHFGNHDDDGLDTDKYFYVGSSGNALQKQLLELLIPATPIKAEIVDELSEYVEYYTAQPDFMVTQKNLLTGETTILWKDGSVTADGFFTNLENARRPIISSATYTPSAAGVTNSTGTVRVVFDPEYLTDVNCVYTVSYNVKVTQDAYRYLDAEKKYPNVGAKDTDYDNSGYTNATSSEKPGFFSNHRAYVNYEIDGDVHTEEAYTHPVVQIATTEITVEKIWQDMAGNETTPLHSVEVEILQNATEMIVEVVEEATEDQWISSNALEDGKTYLIKNGDHTMYAALDALYENKPLILFTGIAYGDDHRQPTASIEPTDPRAQWICEVSNGRTTLHVEQNGVKYYLDTLPNNNGMAMVATDATTGGSMELTNGQIRIHGSTGRNGLIRGDNPWWLEYNANGIQLALTEYVPGKPATIVETTGDTKTKTFTTITLGEDNDFVLTKKELPVKGYGEDGKFYQYTYSVREVNEEGQTYTATYSDNNTEGITEGTITITNTVANAMLLPETGSSGPLRYILSGLLMMIVSLICGYRMIRKHERGPEGV